MMNHIRFVTRWIVQRVLLLALLLLWPFAAIAALPWAWYTSFNDWGYTPLVQWVEEVEDYFSLKNFRQVFGFVFSKEAR